MKMQSAYPTHCAFLNPVLVGFTGLWINHTEKAGEKFLDTVKQNFCHSHRQTHMIKSILRFLKED